VIVSHSLIHKRQEYFAHELRKQGVEVLEIYPRRWGNLTRDGGFQVHSEGNIYGYVFSHEAIKAIETFKPDWLYVQGEPDSLVAYQMSSLARRINSKFACFTWQNIDKIYFPFQEEVTRSCDLIICGNREAKQIMLSKGVAVEKLVVMPQVGVETRLFKPMNSPKEFSVLFVGRMAPEKGVKLIREAYPETTFVTNASYMELPEIYNKAKVSVQFSYSTHKWKEQCNFVNLEAMACGLPIISSKCGSIPEYLEGSEVCLVEERDVNGLRTAINQLLGLSRKERERIGIKNRDFVVGRYSNRVVAEKLLEAFSGER